MSMLLDERRFQAVLQYAPAPLIENVKAMVAFICSEQVVCSSSQVGGYGNDQRWKSKPVRREKSRAEEAEGRARQAERRQGESPSVGQVTREDF